MAENWGMIFFFIHAWIINLEPTDDSLVEKATFEPMGKVILKDSIKIINRVIIHGFKLLF